MDILKTLSSVVSFSPTEESAKTEAQQTNNKYGILGKWSFKSVYNPLAVLFSNLSRATNPWFSSNSIQKPSTQRAGQQVKETEDADVTPTDAKSQGNILPLSKIFSSIADQQQVGKAASTAANSVGGPLPTVNTDG